MIVTLKLATSLDGRIATASGESRWITGPAAREQVHKLRAVHRAILVGVETVIADDPELTIRLPAYFGWQPCRVVMDSHLRTPAAAKIVRSAKRHRTVVLTISDSNKRLTDVGVEVAHVTANEGRVDPRSALEALETMGLTSVMIEGGGQVAASFLAAGLIDQVEWFRAPIILGDEGRPCVGAFVLKDLARAPRLRRTSVEPIGEDLWERYERV